MKAFFFYAASILVTETLFAQSSGVWSTSQGGNGHFYELLGDSTSISWTAANDAAIARGGHLATISSGAENSFVAGLGTSNLRWIGGYQPPGSPEPGGNWSWVTGEPFTYTNWYPGEPNNGVGGFEPQNYIVLWEVGSSWVDNNNLGPGGFATSKFVVEYDRTALAPQNIVLDFDHDAPFSFVGHTVFNHSLYLPVPVGSMAAAHPNQQYRDAVTNEVRDIFAASGVTNVSITNTPVSGATVVYFANPIDPNLLGKSYEGVDRFNRRSDGKVAVFVNDAQTDAETAAHEVGHALGLRHVDPNSTADQKNDEVMDYEPSSYAPPNFVPRFVNAVSPIFDITAFGATHNPLYHLKRYVDGFTDAELRAEGINPGTWDLQQPFKFRLGFTDSQRMLFNVSLLVSSGAADSLESIAHYDQITLEALQALEFDIDPGMALTLLASSTSSGPLDVALATGDPYAQNNLFVQPVDGQVSAFLQFQSGTGTYTTLDTATVTGTVVPEPSAALLIGMGFLGLVIIQRRNRHLTMRCSAYEGLSRVVVGATA